MPHRPVLVLGCGYTGRRVARRLLAAGRTVIATARDPGPLASLEAAGAIVRVLDLAQGDALEVLEATLPEGLRLLWSVPPVRVPGSDADPAAALLAGLARRVVRVVYLSSTGVYGARTRVDETTPAQPATPQQRARAAAEAAILGCGVSALVLRAPAIYGPGRGVHALMRAGRYRLVGRGENAGSRIHVDDLADLAVAGLDSTLEGAWPVADERPAPAAEVAAFCALRLGVPYPPSVAPAEAGETRRTSRRVDGRALRARLGVTLRHPTYREGIPAALAEEAGA